MTPPTTKPQRVQLSREKGWRMPPNTVKVDRTTRWGNPWRVWQDADGDWMCSSPQGHIPVTSKANGIGLAVLLHAQDETRQAAFIGGGSRIVELHGKNLACWCRLDQPCHADILLKLANPEPTP